MTARLTRFAPSPTGYLHVGHAYSALTVADFASSCGARLLLRIEDIDHTRCRPAYTEAIFEDLAWLGLRWETPVRIQSAHLDDYRDALDRLKAMGLVYPCDCTRGTIRAYLAETGATASGPDGPVYPGICRRKPAAERAALMASGRAVAWRLDVGAALSAAGADLIWRDDVAGTIAADPARFGDVVLARKDIGTSYHLAVTVDDHLQGITDVVRGQDLFESTHIHRLLQALLGYATPYYRHHRLIADETGRKFAKRDGDRPLRDLRAAGVTPAALRAEFGLPFGRSCGSA